MKIGILGAGSWAIALSTLLENNGHTLNLWEFNEKEARLLREKHEHPVKLPGIKIPESVTITSKIGDLFEDSEYVIIAVPAQFVRATMKMLLKEISIKKIDSICGWVIVSKGIEIGSNAVLTDVIMQEISHITMDKLAVLSGPSHAEEVGRKLPTTVVAASTNNKLAEKIQQIFSNKYFRVYTSQDVIGVELAGSVKNVIAVAAGACDGLGYGDNTKGALLTRGIAEMVRLGLKMGAQEHTFSGLAGFGDLITTCCSKYSRNRNFGELIASGLSLQEALQKMTMVAEGATTVKSVYALSQKMSVDMPITAEVYNALYKGKNPQDIVTNLMTRELKAERVV
ncbi:MAG: NAD(P)-dependent glycerol-3-phosphate dehydrogenase [Chitinispirillales bacterium]|jgi:glycerol-3-phosphate dehydrogenase (NAD(P)+)|nr:NAD(P)-dependent glycerol-3-phosphate dehydrogenase [Chitinispirillales bacterium]